MVLLSGVIVMIGPLIWMVLTSFKSPADAATFFAGAGGVSVRWDRLLPSDWILDAYRAIFTERPLARYFLNSALYTVAKLIPGLLFCSLAGFVFAKYQFKGKNLLFAAIILTMMVPFQVKMLTLYEIMVDFGWIDTYWAVISIGLMEPLGIFLFRQTIREIPDSLFDAARVDGCGVLRMYRTVVIPLIGPTLAAYAIFLFMWSWSDFLWPLIAVSSETLKPLEVGILGFSDINNPEYVKMMAASTVAVSPVIVFFLFMQKRFIQGVTLSGVKA